LLLCSFFVVAVRGASRLCQADTVGCRDKESRGCVYHI